MDLDPLSYGQYNAFHPLFHPQPIITNTQQNIENTQPNTSTQFETHQTPIPNPYYNQLPFHQISNATQPVENDTQNPVSQYPNMPEEATDNPEPVIEEEDIKPDISKIIIKKPKRVKGKTSSYWNKKVTDKSFKFYGCSVCNIAFQDLTELDSHVTIHTNRVTSYDIRLQNQQKKKRLKKEKKKKKKESKVKTEVKPELDIKPEDGYIGTEKAVDTCQIDNDSCQTKVKKVKASKKVDLGNTKGVVNHKDAVYKCFACNKKFALSYYLRIHVRSHTDEKPYVCNYCGLSFITASKRSRHIKRIHLSVRHQCRICYKLYNRFEFLTKHFDQKHADQKLEGEPYDYNAILPYLTELEDEFKLEEDKKQPKTENIWGDGPIEDLGPLGGAQEAPGGVDRVEDPASRTELLKIEMPELEIEDKEPPLSKYKIEEIEVKCEMVDSSPGRGGGEEEMGPELEDERGAPSDGSDDEEDPRVRVEGKAEPVKEERFLSDDDDEYFPPGGWARTPPRASPPRVPTPPLPKRKGGPGVCDLCNRSFSSRSYLKVHMRTHTGEKPFSCYICGRGFITANKMHRHVLTHDETWVGENCIKPETADIKSETEDDDGGKKQKKSSKVGKAKNKILKKLNQKKDPKLKISRSWQHRCEFCDKKFLHFETLQVHKKCHDGEELVLKCHYCLEPQLDQAAKDSHELTHADQKKPYLCTLCGRCYKNSAAMIYHRKNHKADSEKPFICDICSKRFDTHTKLARHIPTHSTEKFVHRFECPVCANMFHTRWHVQMHLKSHQKEGLILEENRNAVLAMVLQNARKIPLGPPAGQGAPPAAPAGPAPRDERSRICNICGQVFQHFYYLEEHLKTHGNKIAVHDLEEEEEKKYTCQVCSKSFKLHYYLKLHSFTHTKEKPFICQQCGKGFITKGKLKRHLETHQGLKKYQCHICCKYFTRPSYMRIHVRTIHGTQDYNFRDYGIGVPVGIGVPTGLGVPLGQISDNSM